MKLRKNSRLHPLSFLGMVMLVIAGLTRMLFERQWHVSENVSDPILGVLYGVAIGAMLVGIWRQTRRQRDCSSAS
jgi:uncharacterized membrane protein YadS